MNKRNILIPLAVLVCLLLVTGALALPAGFSIPWWTVDGGGGESVAGEYRLTGTIGQAEGGVMKGDQYTLSGGYWGGPLAEAAPGFQMHMPVIFAGD